MAGLQLPKIDNNPFGKALNIIGSFSPTAAWDKYVKGDSTADVIRNYDYGGAFNPANSAPGGWAEPKPYVAPEPLTATIDELSHNVIYEDDPKQPTVDPAGTAAAQRAAAIRAQATPLQQALSALDTTLAHRESENRQVFDRNMAEYNAAEAADRANFEKETSRNEQRYEGNRQNRLYEGGQLNRRLRALLGSMGALNGTGSFLAGEAVQDITNRALGEGRDAFTTNAEMLTGNWSEAEREHRQRKSNAESILEAANQNARADVLNMRQQILNQLGNLFGADTAEGANYLGQAGSLYGEIANAARPNVAQYQKASSLFSPGALQDYLATIGDTRVNTTAGRRAATPINSPLFTTNNRRREEQLI